MTDPWGIETRPEEVYQVGGSLAAGAPSYVVRQADAELENALRAGELCYVLDARQMGKSSLQVRARHQLEARGAICAFLDMTRIGGQTVRPDQWYAGITAELWRGFDLDRELDFKTWWRDRDEIAPLHRLSRFLEDVALPRRPDRRLYIFLDEIDHALSLPFPVDDLFAWIRFCANQRRAEIPPYDRLTFALFGVTTPTALIRDTSRTPFNLGRAIALSGFERDEAEPLAQGLVGLGADPRDLLDCVLSWTGGQPFLTQKLCRLVAEAGRAESGDEMRDSETRAAERLVDRVARRRIVEHWESQDEPEHLRTIRDHLTGNETRAGRLLTLYQSILEQGGVPCDDSREQARLQLSGLVVRDGTRLRPRNRIYREVFHAGWVAGCLNMLRPYAQSLRAWLDAEQRDDSRLLRGQALRDAQNWAAGKSLPDLDYRFLAAGAALDRREGEQALEAARAREVEARLEEKQQRLADQECHSRRQRHLILALSTALLIAVALGAAAWVQTQRALRSEARAAASAAEAHVNADQAERVADFLAEIFGVYDPRQARGRNPTAKEILDRGAARARSEMSQHPRAQAGLMITIGDIYRRLGFFDQARPLLVDALAIRRRLHGEEHVDTAEALYALAFLDYNQQHDEDAETRYLEALALRERLLGPNHPDVAQTLNNYGILLTRQQHFDEAEPLLRRALAIREEALGPEHPDVAQSLNNLAEIATARGLHQEALTLLQRGLDIREKSLAPNHPDLAANLEAMAVVYDGLERYDEAEGLHRRALAIWKNSLGERHPNVALCITNLGLAFQRRGLYADAEMMLQRSLEVREEAFGPDHPDVARALVLLAEVRVVRQHAADAEPLYRRAIEILERAEPPASGEQWDETVQSYGDLLSAMGRTADADALHSEPRRALALRKKTGSGKTRP